VVVVAVVLIGRSGFWRLRGPQPPEPYPVLAAGAVLSAALPLMIPSAGPQYVTVAVPPMTVLLVDTWRRTGVESITAVMVVWSVAAWLSMIVQEVPFAPVKLIGPMTLVLLALAPPSLSVLRDVSRPGQAANATIS